MQKDKNIGSAFLIRENQYYSLFQAISCILNFEYLNGYDRRTSSFTFLLTLRDESLLEYIFMNKGKVNIQQLQSLINDYGKKQEIIPLFILLQSKGLIEPVDSFVWKVTSKAKWMRIYKSQSWIFWLIVIGVLLTVLTLILS